MKKKKSDRHPNLEKKTSNKNVPSFWGLWEFCVRGDACHLDSLEIYFLGFFNLSI